MNNIKLNFGKRAFHLPLSIGLAIFLIQNCNAAVPAVGGPYGFGGGFYPSVAAWCKAGTFSPWIVSSVTQSGAYGTCSQQLTEDAYGYSAGTILVGEDYGVYACPPNSEPIYSGYIQQPSCSCQAMYVEMGGRCVDPYAYGEDYIYQPGDVDPPAAPPDSAKDQGCNQSNSADSGDDLALNGNPCNASNGRKLQHLDIVSTQAQRSPSLQLLYNSQTAENSQYWYRGIFGVGWSHQYDRHVNAIANDLVQVRRSNGKSFNFKLIGQKYLPDADVADKLTRLTDSGGNTVGWLYQSVGSGELEAYDVTGNLISLSDRSGSVTTLIYSNVQNWTPADPSPGLLIQVTESSGRKLLFSYDELDRVAKVTDSAGQNYFLGYDADGNLSSVAYPGAPARTKILHYNETANTSGATLTNSLTGITDEAGVRFADFKYDSAGQAISTQHFGGSDRYQLSYAGTTTTISDPLGTVRINNFSTILGIRRITNIVQPYGDGQVTMSLGYDNNGNVTSLDDFDGNRKCSNFDLARNLRVIAVEGLSGGVDCASVTGVNATLPAGSRKISTAWHPVWNMKVREASPRKITTWVYNGQPDPTNGNQVANCAPMTAKLSDGSPIAVLCKLVEQGTTDVNGSKGLTATLDTTVANKTWSYTYNEQGQVGTVTNPLGKLTTYSYYATSGPNYMASDLMSVTNPKSQSVQFLKYDAAGRVTQLKKVNGVVVDYTYGSRGELLGVVEASADGAISRMYVLEYGPTLQLTKATSPGGASISFNYDASHRMVGMTDAAGNAVTFTLDAAGNRVKEIVSDSNGISVRNIDRVFDALGRLQSVTGAKQ